MLQCTVVSMEKLARLLIYCLFFFICPVLLRLLPSIVRRDVDGRYLLGSGQLVWLIYQQLVFTRQPPGVDIHNNHYTG